MSNNQEANRLEASIPANNYKIIEVYNKLRGGQIKVNHDYQRKLVWKKVHKLNFIDTILKNFPFPEIYLAPGNLDQETLVLIDEIVDGQQRLSAIKDYIEGLDVFATGKLPIKRFNELDVNEKNSFLNYEVSVRYLKNVTPEQVREIFQRINKTDYALNKVERLHAQWGDSEFICFSKQIIERDFDSESAVYIMDEGIRNHLLSFFHGTEDDDSIFSGNDSSRMLAVQYIMVLVATLDSGEYFNRNDAVEHYIESYNESFGQASNIAERLFSTTEFIQNMQLKRSSRWFNKANLFTLIVELDRHDLNSINSKVLTERLNDFDLRANVNELLGTDENHKLTSDEIKYLSLAREAVNDKSSRQFRGNFIASLIKSSMDV